MIGKIVIGKDFYGVLAYNEKKVEEGVGYVIDSNIGHSTSVNMTNEFNLVRQLRPGLGKAVFHVSLNLPYSDQLNDKDFASFGCDYLMKMGFDNNQFIMYRHTDTKHEHIHIIANRVRYSGKLTSDSNIKRRSRAVLNELELKYGLTQVLGVSNSKKSLDQKEIEKTLRTGAAPTKLFLQNQIGSIILKARDTKEFIELLKADKISPRFNVSKTTGRVSGISFNHQGIIYKGSTLGKQYSWNSIKKHIDYEQDRDSTIVFKNNNPIGAVAETVRAIGNGPQRAVELPAGNVEGPENAHEKPEYHVGKDKGIGWVAPLVEENPWNAFKLELEESDRFRRKKRRKKKGLGR
ncbi:MAG: relaxase/mobilization nuclease domain-containing protein [Bacteroidota bacterium]